MTNFKELLKTLFARRRQLVLGVLGTALLASIAVSFILPEWFPGPFSIGLPSETETLVGHYNAFSISYPRSWVGGETPTGNHGDMEVIAGVGVPRRSWPNAYIALHAFPGGTLPQVAAWGESRAKNYGGYVSKSLNAFSSPHFDGLLRTYSWKSPVTIISASTAIQCEDWYVLRGTSGYDLSLCVEQSDWPTVEPVFQKVILSFAIP